MKYEHVPRDIRELFEKAALSTEGEIEVVRGWFNSSKVRRYRKADRESFLAWIEKNHALILELCSDRHQSRCLK